MAHSEQVQPVRNAALSGPQLHWWRATEGHKTSAEETRKAYGICSPSFKQLSHNQRSWDYVWCIRLARTVGRHPRVTGSWMIGQCRRLRTESWGHSLDLRGRKSQEKGGKYKTRSFIFVLFTKYLFSSSYNLPWRHRGEYKYSSTLSLTSALDGVSGLRHAPGPFTHGKNSRYPLYIRVGGSQGRSGRRGKPRPHRGSSPGPSSLWQVAILTTLFRPTPNTTRANRSEMMGETCSTLRTWEIYEDFWSKN